MSREAEAAWDERVETGLTLLTDFATFQAVYDAGRGTDADALRRAADIAYDWLDDDDTDSRADHPEWMRWLADLIERTTRLEAKP